MYRGMIYVQSTKIEDSSAHSYTKLCRLVLREKSLIKERNWVQFYSLYHIRKRYVKPAHKLISDSFGVVKSCVLRGEGSRD